MRIYRGRDVLVGAMTFLLAVSLAGGCRSSNENQNLSLAGGLIGGGGGPGPAPVSLGSTLATFRVMASSTVANTGPTFVDANLGTSPGTSVTGFPPGTLSGMIHAGDATAATAQSELTSAFNDAAGRASDATVSGNLGGQTFPPGVYTSSSSLAISSGDLTLTGLGDPNAVFIFQMGSTLTVTSGRQVVLIGGAQASNVFWVVGSSATIGTTADISGTIMAQSSITLETDATLHGRAYARSGGVTLDTNMVVP